MSLLIKYTVQSTLLNGVLLGAQASHETWYETWNLRLSLFQGFMNFCYGGSLGPFMPLYFVGKYMNEVWNGEWTERFYFPIIKKD